MTRSRKFMINTIASVFYQLIVMASGIILPRIMLLFYGSSINGLVSSIIQFLSYFNMVEAGLASAAIFALYKPLADENHSQIDGIMSATRSMYISTGNIFSALVVVFSFIFPFIAKSSGLANLQITILVCVIGAVTALDFYTLGKYRAILTADQRSYIISIASGAYYILQTLIVYWCAVADVDIVLARFFVLASVVVRSLLLYIYCRKRYSYINYHAEPNNKALSKRWDALYLQIVGIVQRSSPVVLATIFTNLKEVSVYSIYNMVMNGIAGVLDIFLSGLSASFGDIIARKEKKTLQNAFNDFCFSYYGLLTIVYATTMLLILPFVDIYTASITDANYHQPLLAVLIVLNGYLYNIKTPFGMLIMSAGHFRETRLQTTIQGLIIIVLGVVLTPKFGLVGVMLASCLSNLYRDVEMVLYVSKRILNTGVLSAFKRITLSIGSIAVIMAIFAWIKPSISGMKEWVLWAIVIAMVSVLVVSLVSFLLDRKQLKYVMGRIKDMLKRK